jgi:hypothetical protein
VTEHEALFDVLSVRTSENGARIKAIIAGPYSAVEAAYQAERLTKQRTDESCEYQVVEHHVCNACSGVDEPHTCTTYLKNL